VEAEKILTDLPLRGVTNDCASDSGNSNAMGQEKVLRVRRGRVSDEGIYGACFRRNMASPAPSKHMQPTSACAHLGRDPGKPPIQPFPASLARRCFNNHVDHNIQCRLSTN
jgi:hypothetical protein